MINRIEADMDARANLDIAGLIYKLVLVSPRPVKDIYNVVPALWDEAVKEKSYAYTISGEKSELEGYDISEDDITDAVSFLLCDYLGYTDDSEPTLTICPGGIL